MQVHGLGARGGSADGSGSELIRRDRYRGMIGGSSPAVQAGFHSPDAI
jgi:hypothetical protein